MKIAIIGAGILGRFITFELLNSENNFELSLFDQNKENDINCSRIAGGMLSPLCELYDAEKIICDLGVDSIELLEQIILKIDYKIFFQKTGTLVIAHQHDNKELEIFKRNINSKTQKQEYKNLNKNDIENLEPDLEKKFSQGMFFENEAQIDNVDILNGLLFEFKKHKNIKLHFETKILNFDKEANEIVCEDLERKKFDLIIDCMGVNSSIKNLRGVRGEIITLHSTDIKLSRPIRLIHPRFPLYIIPRANNKILVGATSIESSDRSEISIRSALELLTSAFSINSKFGEARILNMESGLRPTLPDGNPKILYTSKKRFLQINGLYRHGFLVSPKISQLATKFILFDKIEEQYKAIFEKIND
jgi:glycine oxidase